MFPTFFYTLQTNLPVAFTEADLTPLDVANRVIAYAILAAFFLCVVYVFYGGFRFIFSGGDDGRIRSWKL